MRSKLEWLKIISVCLSLAMLSCSGGGSDGESDMPPGETPLSPEEQAALDLENYLKEQFASSVLSNDAYGLETDAIAVATPVFAEVSDTAVEEVAVSAADDFSQTNIQEAGVDEADKVKTDGTYMYIADGRNVSIIKAVPRNEMQILNAVEANGWVSELYLYNDILVILFVPGDGSGGGYPEPDRISTLDIGMPYWLPRDAQIGVMLVDVSEPSTPATIKTVVADGLKVSSRLTGGKLYIVQQYLPDLPALQLNHDGTEEDREVVISANQVKLRNYTLDDLIPSFESLDADGNVVGSGRLVAVEDFSQPDDPQGGSIVSVLSLDLNDPEQAHQSAGFIADAHFIYASTASLYVGATIWNDHVWMDETYDQSLQTIIHRFDLTGDQADYMSTGQAPGRILNQFSLGEYQDVLRIATTTGWGWGRIQNSHVYCLEESDGQLEVIGRLEGLAPGEDIYSARFIGERGFLVTFVKIDPLFTLDLSDPADPKVAGELKVPGYSDYIHPLGENHLLTIGKDTILEDDFAWYQGLQLSIFDITDFANPTLLHKELIGDRGTSSEALYSHKAFTFWSPNNLLAIPVDLYEHEDEPEYPSNWGSYKLSGLYVYRTTAENGFEYLGLINTSDANSYGWTRGIFIDSTVYAVKSDVVRSADIADMANSVNTVSLVD